MKYTKLGNSDLEVSKICLGTMTFGLQNVQKDTDEQIAYSMDQGINFWDTAELYAVPPSKKTYGKTEEMLGDWLSRNPGKREELIIMSKIAGKGLSYIRGGDKILAKYIEQSVDDSLKRLQTDYMDVYQLHWPNRPNPHFNRHAFTAVDFAKVDREHEEEEILAVLQALDKCVKAGKIRYCGLSNETPWGIEKYLQLAKDHNLPKMISVQNEFSLIQTKDWPYVTESCVLNDVAYLPWSPLGSGALSGKYAGGARPEGSRWTYEGRHGTFRDQPRVHEAVAAYKAIADKNNITVAQLSLAWCYQLDWVTSTIIGATKMTQLKDNIDAFDVTLNEDTLKEIYEVRRRYAIPYA